MRIAITGIDVHPPFNEGVKRNAFNLAKALKRAGHDAFVYTMARGLKPQKIEDGLNVARIDGVDVYFFNRAGFNNKTELYQNFLQVPSFVRAGRALFKRKKPDVIHGHYPVLSAGFLDVLMRNEEALVAESAYGAFYDLRAAKDAAPSTFFYEQLPHLLFNNARAARFASRGFDLVLPVNEFAAKQLRSQSNDAGFKTRVIPNGVDLKEFNPRRANKRALTRVGADARKLTVLYAGHLNHPKGVGVLVRAFAKTRRRARDAQLVLACSGGGTEQEKIRRLVKTLSLEKNVKFFEGPVDVGELMASSDVFVLPRIHEYGTVLFPNTILEAMACGTPVVTTRVGGVEEIAGNGNALLVPPRDEDALANAMTRLLESSALRKKTASRALRAVKRFDWNVLAKDYAKAYAQAKRTRSGRRTRNGKR